MNEYIQFSLPTKGDIITAPSGIDYKVGQPIKEGGYALVFEGEDIFENPVVLKVFKPANRDFEEVKKQWKQEVQKFRLLRHPNVVAIYDDFECENLFYIVLERALGSLDDLIQTKGAMPEFKVKEIARQLLFAIHSIHQRGVIHRDITIYNTLVFEGSHNQGLIFKISDFGISKKFFNSWKPKICNTKTAHPLFTPPELLLPQYGYTSEQSDLYHLGIILLYSILGSLPINKIMSTTEIEEIITSGILRQEAERIKTPLGDFIAVLLRRRKEYRFQIAIEAWNALKIIHPS